MKYTTETLEDVYVYGTDDEGTPVDRSSFKQNGRELLAFFRLPAKIVIQLNKYTLDLETKELKLKGGRSLEDVVNTDFGFKTISEVDEEMEIDPPNMYE